MARTTRFALSLTALAAALALTACGRDERIPLPARDNNAATTGSSATGTVSGSTASTEANNPGAMVSNAPTGATGSSSAAPLSPSDAQFVTKAAEGGQFEVEVAKLAADKASDAGVKSFAQMLADDHAAANEKLHQIASSHNVALPASLPADKRKELDQLALLSGPAFDKQFVRTVGVKDHKHDIADFEKASKDAKASDVKDFAESTLPTLKKHLAAAEKLPA